MIRAGLMRHKLIFQTKAETSDGFGAGGTETWSDTLTIKAELWKISGSERVEAARSKQNSIYRWHCRYYSVIVPKMRIKWTDRKNVTHYQEILAVNPLGNRIMDIEILAEEKV